MGRFVFPDEAKMALGKRMGIAATTLMTYTFRLFSNAIVVASDTTLADFTECDYSGYAAQVDTGPSINLADGFAGDTTLKATLGPLVEVFPGNLGSPQTAYGFYVDFTDSDDVQVLFGASNAFDAVPTLALDGLVVGVPGPIIAFQYRLWDYLEFPPPIPRYRVSWGPPGNPTTFTVQALNKDGSTDTTVNTTVYLWNATATGPNITGLGPITLTDGVGSASYSWTHTDMFFVTPNDTTGRADNTPIIELAGTYMAPT